MVLDARRIKPLIDPLVRLQDAVGSTRDCAIAKVRIGDGPLSDALDAQVASWRAAALQVLQEDLGAEYRNRLALAVAQW